MRRTPSAPPEWMANVVTAVAALGFGVTLGLGFTAETHGSLVAAGGLATAAGRFAGLTGTYLLLVLVLLISRLPWLERVRPGPPRPVAPAAGSVAHRPAGRARRADHDRLRAAGVRRPLASSGRPAHRLSGRARRDGGVRADRDGRRDVVASCSPPGCATRPGGRFTCTPTSRSPSPSPTNWPTRLLRRPSARPSVLGSGGLGVDCRRRARVPGGRAGTGARSTTVCGLSRCEEGGPRRRVGHLRRTAPGPVAGRGGPVPAECQVLTGGLWWQATRTPFRRCRRPPYIRITIKALGDFSESVAKLSAGTPVAIEGPYGVVTKHSRSGDKVLLVAAGVGITPMRRCWRTCPPPSTSWSCCERRLPRT